MTQPHAIDAAAMIAALEDSELRKACAVPIFAAAEDLLLAKMARIGNRIEKPTDAGEVFRMRMAYLEHEEFHAMWLDQKHSIIAIDRLFTGSIAGAAVYLREVVKRALSHNAAAVIVSHGHPSGSLDPSAADRALTTELRRALELIEVRLLDHIIVSGNGFASMGQRGLI